MIKLIPTAMVCNGVSGGGASPSGSRALPEARQMMTLQSLGLPQPQLPHLAYALPRAPTSQTVGELHETL